MSSRPSVFMRLFPQIDLIEELFPSQMEQPRTDKSLPVFLMDYGTRISYRTNTGRNREPTTIKTNKKIPSCCPVYYFEVKIDDLGSGGPIAIGIVPSNYHTSKLIGHDRGYGFTVDDGRKHCEGNHGSEGGAVCVRGDVVGMAVSLHSPGANLIFNFGHKTFMFDLDTYANGLISWICEEITHHDVKLSDPAGNAQVLEAITDYMAYHSNTETASELSSLLQIPITKTPDELDCGKEIHQLLAEKNYKKIHEIVLTRFNFIETEHPRVYLSLLCLQFFNLTRGMCVQLKTNDMTLQEESEALRDIIMLGRNIYILYNKYVMNIDSEQAKMYCDECDMTERQWNKSLKKSTLDIVHKESVSNFERGFRNHDK
ncbi:hypothetical protein HZS_7951, partial [Henneguya salminicola]